MTILDNLPMIFPQLSILLTACLVLVGSLFNCKTEKQLLWGISLAGVLVSLLWSVSQLTVSSTLLLANQFICDDFSQLLNAGIACAVFLIFLYSQHYMIEHQMPMAEVLSLSLFSTFGMMVLVCANTLLTSYLGLELLSLPLYALTAIRRMSGDGSEAGMKYFIMGAIASGLLLYGFSLLYGATGQWEFSKIASAISHGTGNQTLITVSLVFILSALGFKLALVPFHMWAPDVYQGAPLSVTLLLSTAPKIAGLAFMARLLTVAFSAVVAQWQGMLLVMALISIFIGNLFAVVQTDLRRLLAYSAISHMGFAVFGVLVADAAGLTSSIYYVLIYMLTGVAAFGLLVLLSHQALEIESIDDLKGLSKRNPWAALMFMIVLFSMAGVPPTAGFFVKLAVLKALVSAGYIEAAVFAVILAVVGAFYYLRVVKVMYFDNPEHDYPMVLGGNQLVRCCYALNCFALLYFGVFPSGLISLCSNALIG